MTDDTKPLDLSRYEGHTPGPWKHQKLGEPANPCIIAVTAPPGYEHPQFTVAAGTPTGGQGWPAVGLAGRDPMESLINASLIADAPDLLAEVVRLREALMVAEQFISNGIELGYIRMPDPETPDTAHITLPMIRRMLGEGGGV